MTQPVPVATAEGRTAWGWNPQTPLRDLATVSGTPTFFVNGQRHHGPYDIDSLSQAVRTARAMAAITG